MDQLPAQAETNAADAICGSHPVADINGDTIVIPFRSSPVHVRSSARQYSHAEESDKQSDSSDENFHSDIGRSYNKSKAFQDVPNSDTSSVIEVPPQNKTHILIDVPVLADKKAAEFRELSGHFQVTKVLFALPDGEYIVKLQSGEIDQVSHYNAFARMLNYFRYMYET